MKVFMKPVDMISWFTIDGIPHPIKYRICDDSKSIIIKVDKIITISEEKLAGNKIFIFRCKSLMEQYEKAYELKYEIFTCRWYLYKV